MHGLFDLDAALIRAGIRGDAVDGIRIRFREIGRWNRAGSRGTGHSRGINSWGIMYVPVHFLQIAQRHRFRTIRRHGASAHLFHGLLRAEEPGIYAVRRQQFGMRALFDGAAMVEHDHMIGIRRVRHAMRHHDHGSAGVSERAHGAQDQGFAFHVDAAGRLVEDTDGRLAQQHTRDGDTLALPARQVPGALFDAHVESLRLRAHEIVDVRVFQRLP